jgi:hypothetical protein
MQDFEDEVEIPYVWFSEEEWNKIMFHVRSQISAILKPLEIYGQKPFVEGATEELVKLVDLTSQVIRGKDIPIIVRTEPAPSPFD